MGIYIGLLGCIFTLAIFWGYIGLSYEKRKIYLLNSIFILVFLLCILRSYTVGRDVEPYRIHYLDVVNHTWMDFEYIYFEKGYQLLMKICAWFGLSWQWFLTVVYSIIIIPVYLFIKKYSKHIILSILVFICYMYFEFNLTGIRQALASSICLIGLITLLESSKYPVIKYIIIVTIAVFFHKSAFACYFLIPFFRVKNIKTTTVIIIVLTAVGLISRTQILIFIKDIFMKESLEVESSLYFGGNLLFLLVLAFAIIMKEIIRENNLITVGMKTDQKYYNVDGKLLNYDSNDIFQKSFLLSIFFLVLFGMETSARSYMLLNQVIIVLLPNLFDSLAGKSKWIAMSAMTIFLVLFFYFNTLVANNFDIVPYKFFWQ